MKYLFLVIVFMLGGCASFNDIPKEELLWQGLHIIDTAQTINGPASDPCYTEVNPLTKKVIGHHPSKEGTYTTMIAFAGLHYLISDWLKDNGPKWAYVGWQSVTLGATLATLHRNDRKGVKLYGDNNHNNVNCYRR